MTSSNSLVPPMSSNASSVSWARDLRETRERRARGAPKADIGRERGMGLGRGGPFPARKRPHTSFAEPVAAPIAARQLHAHRFHLKAARAQARNGIIPQTLNRCGTLKVMRAAKLTATG